MQSHKSNFFSFSNWWLNSAAIGLASIFIAAMMGGITNFYNGEEFYIYQYASNLPHLEAVKTFFYENSRIIEGIYWIYQYKLLGYNPLLTHALSFVLLLVVAILASAVFLNAWPQKRRTTLLPYLFVFLLFLNWIAASSVFRQSYDNGRLSLVFFFMGGLALQKWAATQRGRWLLLSFSLQLCSILTYENAAFLFPALLLLAWPLLPEGKRASTHNQVYKFLGLASISGLLLLIPQWLYGFTARSSTFDIASMPLNMIQAGPDIYLRFGQIFKLWTAPLNFFIPVAIFLLLVFSSAWIIRLHANDRKYKRYLETKDAKLRWTCIYLASLWLLIFGPLPYVLLGYGVGGRIYSSAVFGIFPLLLMLLEVAASQKQRVATVILLVGFAVSGLLMTASESTMFNGLEARFNTFYLGLKEAVPYVRSDTIFIIIESPIEIPSCAASLEMLYNQDDLRCIMLSPFSTKSATVRHAAGIENYGQNISGPDWIILKVEDNVPKLIDEVKPGDYGLLIDWESTEPIRTNSDRIITDGIPPANAFYLHLLERAKVLSPER